ncbi:MAG TPA: ATP-binding protein [Gemmatimonadales bacterium]
MAEFPDMNPGPVLRLDRDGIIERVNKAAREVFTRDDLVGQCWLDVCPLMTREWWDGVLRTPEPVTYEADVHDCCIVFTHAHRPDAAHVFVFGTDVTARRQAERTLAEQARQLADMARFPEMNPGPVCRLDRHGSVVLANAAARRLFDRDTLVGLSWLDVCPAITRERWEHILAASTTSTHETSVNGRDMVFTHTPATEAGLVFVYGADVTEQKAAERALRQTEKMATLGTLSAGVAHELNNPAAAAQRAADHLREEFARLQAVQIRVSALRLSEAEREALAGLDTRARARAGCACELDPLARSDREDEIETWLDEIGVEDPPLVAAALVEMDLTADHLRALAGPFAGAHRAPVAEWLGHVFPVYRLLDEIHHGAARISEIIGALKEYSYLGQAPVQAVDVNQGLRNTLIILRGKLKQGVTVIQEFADDLPRIQGYGSELNQVWTNLIDNAAAAMDGKGQIVLRTRGADGRVVVEVEDDGPGIPSEHHSRIFDAFFTTKPPGQGTGLGLHTCYTIVVKKHGGTIDVESQPGRTRFVVVLPSQLPAGNAAASQP